MTRLLLTAATALALSACTNFPCSPENPCAPGDGGAGLRAAHANWMAYNEPRVVLAPPPMIIHRPTMTTCQRAGLNTIRCF